MKLGDGDEVRREREREKRAGNATEESFMEVCEETWVSVFKNCVWEIEAKEGMMEYNMCLGSRYGKEKKDFETI